MAPARQAARRRTPKRPEADGLFDQVDRRIISLLQKNGRMSNSAIARALDLSEPTVRRRISQMVTGSRLRILPIPSPDAANLVISAIFSMSVDLTKLDAIARHLMSYNEIRYVAYTTGIYDLFSEGFFYSNQDLLNFITNKIAAIPGIRNTVTSVVLKTAKFSFEWELPLETLTRPPR